MPPQDEDPRSRHDVDTAPDRRRPGRAANANPLLVALMRGQIDPDAPADPVIPDQRSLNRELLLGGALVITLFLAGALVRFAL